ncbi:MAG: hypothetical protein HRU15_13575 [Planctomycetes bacterium]|nr:hypothetical protein [Planctomycetota bacterium]
MWSWRSICVVHENVRRSQIICSWHVAMGRLQEHLQNMHDYRLHTISKVDPRLQNYAELMHAVHDHMDDCVKLINRCGAACDSIDGIKKPHEEVLQPWQQALMAVEKECRQNALQHLRVERLIKEFAERSKNLRFENSKAKAKAIATATVNAKVNAKVPYTAQPTPRIEVISSSSAQGPTEKDLAFHLS